MDAPKRPKIDLHPDLTREQADLILKAAEDNYVREWMQFEQSKLNQARAEVAAAAATEAQVETRAAIDTEQYRREQVREWWDQRRNRR
jgi:hypothetical protein